MFYPPHMNFRHFFLIVEAARAAIVFEAVQSAALPKQN
jgi:hypothetical protein